MKKFFAAIYILPMVLWAGCSNKTSQTEHNIPVIQIEKAFNSEDGALLGNWAKSIEYIPLETNEESLLSDIQFSDLYPLKERIYIFTHNGKNITCFDYNGKYIPFKLHKGRAENELAYPQNMIADEENVIVNDCFHLKIYDHNGNFIRKSADLNKPDYLQHLYIHKTGDGNFLFKGEDPDNTSDYACIVDADGNTIAQTLILNYSASEVENFKSRSGASSKFSGKEASLGSRVPPRIKPAGENAFLIIPNNDTLWRIDERNAGLIPAYIADCGEYGNVGNRPVEYNRVIGETNDLLIVKFLFSPISYPNIDKKYIQSCFVHDKVTNTTLMLKHDPKSNCTGFINNLDGGIAFYPSAIANGKMYQIVDAADFIDAAEMTESKKMMEVAATITEESNPVLIVCTLK
ncbi:MAG: 6-bladed beta-propeller [Bacteroidales bacterium]|nr:6-bladed beta-propeller [Bacteroidales bacterium]